MTGQAASNLVVLPVAGAGVPGAREVSLPSSRPAERVEAPRWLSPAGRRAFKLVADWLFDEAPDWLGAVDADALGLCVEHLSVAIAASKAMRGPGGHYRPLVSDGTHDREHRKNPAQQVFRDATASYLAVARDLALTPRIRRQLEIAVGYNGSGPDDDDPAGIFDA